MGINIKYIVILMIVSASASALAYADAGNRTIPSDYAMEEYQAPKTVRFSKHPFTWAHLKYLRWKDREVMVTKTRPVDEFTIISEEPVIQKSEVVEEKRIKRVDPKIDQDSVHHPIQQQAQFNIIPQNIRLQPAIKKAIQDDCGRSVREYHDELVVAEKRGNPKEIEYKKWKYESMLKRCRTERKAR